MGSDPFVNRFGHTSCLRCKRTHVKGDYYPYCGFDCKHIYENDNGANGKYPVSDCENCGRSFKCPDSGEGRGSNKYCSKFCRTYAAKSVKGTKKGVPINELNERWVSREKAPGGRNPSYDKLNQEAERKRVFDDKGWDHYLRGRKWERI